MNWVQFYCRSRKERSRSILYEDRLDVVSLSLSSSAVLQEGSIKPQEADSHVGTANIIISISIIIIASALDIQDSNYTTLLQSQVPQDRSHDQSLASNTAHPAWFPRHFRKTSFRSLHWRHHLAFSGTPTTHCRCLSSAAPASSTRADGVRAAWRPLHAALGNWDIPWGVCDKPYLYPTYTQTDNGSISIVEYCSCK